MFIVVLLILENQSFLLKAFYSYYLRVCKSIKYNFKINKMLLYYLIIYHEVFQCSYFLPHDDQNFVKSV